MESSRPRVFLDVSEGGDPMGRLVIELFVDKTPRTCENFRSLCTGSDPSLSYKGSVFHRIIDEFMVQGGDITRGDGTGGESIYGGEFQDENIGWREIDEAGLVCMANRGKDTNSSQFFITLAPCPHLNAKHTVFGRLVSGQPTLKQMSQVRTDKNDRPLTDVIVSHSGELERRKKLHASTGSIGNRQQQLEHPSSHATSEERSSRDDRGRRKRRRSHSPSRSPSPSRGHGRGSASKHRRHHRKHHRQSSSESISPPPVDGERARRRSDASTDHTLRGRPRKRSQSRTRSPIMEDSDSGTPVPAHRRKRSQPPSRRDSGERSRSPDHRRQRSIPNVYETHRRREDKRAHERRRSSRERYDKWHRGWEREDEDMLREEEWRREGGASRYMDAVGDDGRLGGDGGGGYGAASNDGVIYKGRGTMKYREKRRW